MNPDTTSPINSKIGNVHICLPQNLRLDNSQVTTGSVIQPNGSYKLRKYPIWLKYSPIVSYIHLSYLDAFGYNIDLIFVKPELYSNNSSAINYVARKVLISHNELNKEYHEIWNSRGLTLNNHDKSLKLLEVSSDSGYNNEYYDLADSLIKQFEDFCNDPDIVKLNDQINNAVIDGGERANDSSSDDK